MELFSEIYSCYYTVVSKILQSTPLSEKDMMTLINSSAYSESALYILPKLCKEGGWELLKKENNNYHSRLNHTPRLPLTLLEKRWLKALLQDSRIRLFLDDTAFIELSEKLSDIKPLYRKEHFKWFDIFTDGDNYSDESYRWNFRTLLKAIHSREILNIRFTSGKGNIISENYLPYRMEYSQKNDKFRVFAAKIKDKSLVTLGTINLSRIEEITNTGQTYPNSVDISQIFQWKRCKEPVTLEISKERNGVERFMMEFAAYEKNTEIDEESGKCRATLWYDLQDETEILIRLLGFGPVLRVTGPQRMVAQMQERVNKQYSLLFPD